jgi:anti-sigma factor RsiW
MSAVFQAGVLATKAVEMFSFSHASKQRVVPGIPICLSLSKARSKVPVLEMQHHSLGPLGQGRETGAKWRITSRVHHRR